MYSLLFWSTPLITGHVVSRHTRAPHKISHWLDLEVPFPETTQGEDTDETTAVTGK